MAAMVSTQSHPGKFPKCLAIQLPVANEDQPVYPCLKRMIDKRMCNFSISTEATLPSKLLPDP